MIKTRPTWDEYYIGVAIAVADRADCLRSAVGAVLVKDNRIMATGYNGAPPGAPGCLTAGACPRGRLTYEERPPGGTYGDCIAIHAERNALEEAGRRGTIGATLYVTRAPCGDCEAAIWFSGVVRIVYASPEGLIVLTAPEK
ncbi:cell division protein DedD [Streptomyces cadmiisoli]|uniref:Cell division protein DedD n=1 Tax=Streptomyces cadmiisoli TaxID=2184053 RepID=A0A2Z4J6M7_9ACTN|nr:cell division protein DedD [Streptomyces cadmiisoli]